MLPLRQVQSFCTPRTCTSGTSTRTCTFSDVSVSTSLSTSTCAMCIHMSCATSFIGNTLSCTLSYVLLHARLTIFQHLTRCYLASLTVLALSNTSLSYKLHSSHMPSMNIETDFVNKKKNNSSTPWTHSVVYASAFCPLQSWSVQNSCKWTPPPTLSISSSSLIRF